ncbi:MAG TPA: hypothetical protein ENN67_06050 [Firmicutes bacterium]|nr:hypothetical protein [Bacillota bacterium]
MTWFGEKDESQSYEFEPERFMVPPTDGLLKRLFGARWGVILLSAPDTVNLRPILDFLADFALQLSFYSRISTFSGEFSELERDEIRIRTIDDILEEAKKSIPEPDEAPDPDDVIRQVPRNPEIIFIPDLNEKIVPSAIESAMSGKLVILGIRSEGSFPALQLYRVLVGSDHLAAATLMGIIAFNTVARICPECRVSIEYDLSDEDSILLGIETRKLKGFRGMGCQKCDNTGTRGQILIHEGFEVSENIRNKILENMPLRNLRLLAKREGMSTLLDAAWTLSEAGETTLEEVMKIADLTDPGRASEI